MAIWFDVRVVGVSTTGILAVLGGVLLFPPGTTEGSSASIVSRRGCDTLIVVERGCCIPHSEGAARPSQTTLSGPDWAVGLIHPLASCLLCNVVGLILLPLPCIDLERRYLSIRSCEKTILSREELTRYSWFCDLILPLG